MVTCAWCSYRLSKTFFSVYVDEKLLDTSSDTSPLKKEESGEEMVFTDATKQLLIKTLPSVLTLHLKRFLQEGRRLRKNG